MGRPAPTLHLICGKIAAGKSTLAARLAGAEATVLISEDRWLGSLFGDQLKTPKDYMVCSRALRAVMGPHVGEILWAGLSVVLDFPANTVEQRDWMRGIIDASGATHQMHVLDIPDDVCLERLRARNTQGDHPFAVTEEQFRRMGQYFVPPGPEEGFTLLTHGVQG